MSSPTGSSSASATLNQPNGIGNGNRRPSDKDRHLGIAPHRTRVEAHGPGAVDLPCGETFQRLFEGDAPLEAGEGGAQTEVVAVAERHVWLPRAVNVEAVGIGIGPLVPAGGTG